VLRSHVVPHKHVHGMPWQHIALQHHVCTMCSNKAHSHSKNSPTYNQSDSRKYMMVFWLVPGSPSLNIRTMASWRNKLSPNSKHN
jgi:hypothetical protein